MKVKYFTYCYEDEQLSVCTNNMYFVHNFTLFLFCFQMNY